MKIVTVVLVLRLTDRLSSKSALFATKIMGNSSRSFTLKICFWNLYISSKLQWEKDSIITIYGKYNDVGLKQIQRQVHKHKHIS